MTITRVGHRGPGAAATGSLSVTWTTSPTANNTLILDVFALSGQAMPATISGWTTVFTNGSGGGFVSAQYKKTATGSESGSQVVLTATVASLAWITEYSTDAGGGAIVNVLSSGAATDADDTSTGFLTTSSSRTTGAADIIHVSSVWASAAPSFPTAPAFASTRTITQSGATLGTIQNRAGATWLTNHRYNMSDISVTSGATAAIVFTLNSGTASLRGISNMTVLEESSAATAPNAVISGPLSTIAGATYTVTDASTVTTSGATIASRVWRVISGGGSLSSTTASPITVTAPATAGTQLLGLIVTDSNGMVSGEAQLSVSVSGSMVVPPDRIVSNTGGWTHGGTATDLVDGLSDSGEWIRSPVTPTGAAITVGLPALPPNAVTIEFYAQLVDSGDTTGAGVGQTGTLNAQFFAGSTPITGVVPTTVTGTEVLVTITLTSGENTAFTAAGRSDPRIEFTATAT